MAPEKALVFCLFNIVALKETENKRNATCNQMRLHASAC